MAAVVPACAFYAEAEGQGLPSLGSASAAGTSGSTGGDDSGTLEGTLGSVPADGTAGNTGSSGELPDTATQGVDEGSTSLADAGEESSTGADAGRSESTGSNPRPTGEPYGPCAGGLACGLEDENHITMGDYSVCALPCTDTPDCPPSPGAGEADCQDIAGLGRLCVIDCSWLPWCPVGMTCNPSSHCAWT